MVNPFAQKGPARLSIVAAALALLVLTALVRPARAADPVNYVLTDIRVLYISDDADAIDWPALYYLNDDHGCRVDIVLLEERSNFRSTSTTIPGREMHLHRLFVPPNDKASLDSALDYLLTERHPDLVLFETRTGEGLYNAFRARLIDLAPSADRRFNILKIYDRITDSNESVDSATAVFLNSRELSTRYSDRIAAEAPRLVGHELDLPTASPGLTRYRLVSSRVAGRLPEIVFLSGIPQNRLTMIIEEMVAEGPKKSTLLRQAREFYSSLRAASDERNDQRRLQLVLEGFRPLGDLVASTSGDPLFDAQVDLRPYITGLRELTEELALTVAGIRWDGSIIVRDSPDGPRLKYRASLSADGPQEAQLKQIQFHPYWDSTQVIIDSAVRTITPHQTFVREYLVDIDPKYLEASRPDSLIFTADLAYGPVPLTMRNAVPVGEKFSLGVSFEPNYYFVPPVSDLDIDRVVKPMSLRVVIQKPRGLAGTVKLNLDTPRGLFAGAYQQEISLGKNKVRESLRIPFSISKLFELGLQHQIISLSYRGNVVATDTAFVRVASCHVDDRTKIAFLPDTTGQLEDILNLTDAGFQPLTDRGLITAPLNVYDVIIIGSGSFRSYPSFPTLKDRFEDFVRLGGSLVILGQPPDFPQDVLPVRFVPDIELVDQTSITNRIAGANILSKPYAIIETGLFSSFYKKRDVASAVIAPSERVYVTPSGAALLAVSRLGEGQIIYCGLPLLDMIAKLDIDAIHLFANILNY